MTTTALGGSATARDLLFGISSTNSAEVLADSLRRNGTVAAHVRCPVGLNAIVEHELASKTDELLSADLADVVIMGWKRYDALRQAAQRTHSAPLTEEIVALAAHTVESSHRPAIEVFIDGASVATINVELKIAVTIDGALAVVRQGWLTGLRTGTFTVGASLAVQQIVFAERHWPFDLPGAILLRHGVPLLSADLGAAPVGARQA
ncbi:hypothetical protein [Mycobacterium sp. URHB0044]|jgi:hypothetical protein|uniref:hypothetical protein n=1 Tax=Mycobacterium sp. URHB0044 TaxID=1380386 RepID=UPI00048B00E3|nr:hypothetical protein [Mycobacterium sp. URHB0044]